MHLEDTDLPSLARLIYPDPILQAEYNKGYSQTESSFAKDKQLSIHEHSERQRKWVEELEKPKN